MLDPHDAFRARRVDEALGVERNRDVRRAGSHRREEEEIAGEELVPFDRRAFGVLLAGFPRQRHAVPRKHPLSEPAAVESIGRRPAISIWRAEERQRCLEEL